MRLDDDQGDDDDDDADAPVGVRRLVFAGMQLTRSSVGAGKPPTASGVRAGA